MKANISRLGWLTAICALSISAVAQQVTGSGSQNQVPKFTGSGTSSTIGNSAITEVGGYVGIGTTSPVPALDVNGTPVFRGYATTFTTTAGWGPQLRFTNAATPTVANWAFGVP